VLVMEAVVLAAAARPILAPWLPLPSLLARASIVTQTNSGRWWLVLHTALWLLCVCVCVCVCV
jgi:hypothetical protein